MRILKPWKQTRIRATNNNFSAFEAGNMSEEYADTQPPNPRPLAGVIAYVDVRSGKGRCENRSKAIAKQLDNLGATIAKRITSDVTHVVYKDGHSNTLEQAKSHSCNIVSVLWVDACVSAHEIAPEGKYPAIYENSDAVILGKIKRIKSMQPKSLDEEGITLSVRKRRKMMKARQPLSNELTNADEDIKVLKKSIVKCRIKSSLVMTSCHRSDQEMVHRVVQRFGRFAVRPTVDETTTHVICGSVRRTYNILLGSVKGCWMLPLEWVWRSLEAGRWVEEGPYELSKDYPAAKYFRETSIHQPFLESIGPVFVSSNNKLSYDQLSFLIQQAGGESTNCLRKAKISLGAVSKDKDVVSVTQDWLFDSITAHQILSTDNYVLSDKD